MYMHPFDCSEFCNAPRTQNLSPIYLHTSTWHRRSFVLLQNSLFSEAIVPKVFTGKFIKTLCSGYVEFKVVSLVNFGRSDEKTAKLKVLLLKFSFYSDN